jgi:hypothetical protein
MFRPNPKLEALATRHQKDLDALGRELAMNFDVPARDLIEYYCSRMGLTRKQYETLRSYIIERDQAATEASV